MTPLTDVLNYDRIKALLPTTPSVSRRGCYYCFQTLNPEDKEVGLRACVQCDQCHRQYHARCWDMAQPCMACHNDTATIIVGLPVPPELQPHTKLRGILVKPSTIIVISNGKAVEYASNTNATLQYGKVLSNSLYSVLLASVFIFVASFIGTLAYPIYRLTEQGESFLRSAVNLIFDPSHARGVTFTVSLLSSAIAAFVFFRPFDSNRRTSGRSTPHFMWLLAGITGLLVVNIVLMRPSLAELLNPGIPIDDNLRVLAAQFVAAFTVMLFAPIYNQIAPKIPPLEIATSPMGDEWYSWVRLIVVSLLLMRIAAYVTSRILLPVSSRVQVWRLSLGGKTFDLESSFTAAFLIAVIIAALVYFPPGHRQLKKSSSHVRLLLIIVAAIGIYSIVNALSISPEDLVTLILVAVTMTLLLVPIQRVLS